MHSKHHFCALCVSTNSDTYIIIFTHSSNRLWVLLKELVGISVMLLCWRCMSVTECRSANTASGSREMLLYAKSLQEEIIAVQSMTPVPRLLQPRLMLKASRVSLRVMIL